MKRIITIKKNQYLSIITFCVIGAVAAFYLLAYIPHSENEIITQRFRTLHRIDKNIHEKIENSTQTLNKILDGYTDDPLATKNFIYSLPKEEFTVSKVECDPASAAVKSFKTVSASSTPSQGDSLVTQNDSINPKAEEVSKPKNKTNQKSKASIISTSSDGIKTKIMILDNEQKFVLTSIKQSGQECQVSMTFTFESFIKPLLRKNVFDAYVVLSKQRTVYETFPAGISYDSKDSLFITKNKVTTSTFRSITIGGIDYKMFLQPVGFDSANEWIVAGLLTADRFDSEKRELPGSWVLALMLTALIGIIILPWLKLSMMGNREKMNTTDGVSSFVSALLLMSFIFLVFIKYNYSFRPDQTDSKRVLSKQIETNLKTDIENAYKQLLQFDTLMKSNRFYEQDFVIVPAKTPDSVQKNKNETSFIEINKLKVKPSDSAEHYLKNLIQKISSYTLSQVFWIDAAGKLTYNWNSDSIIPSKSTPLKTRDYYVQLKKKNTFSLSKGVASNFYITQLISPTYNQFRTYISRESLQKGFSQVMSFDLRSLSNPVMPDGYSFAILNNKGDVLYHADSTYNLNENFIEECSNKSKLISAISSKTEGKFETKYYGINYRMLIRPIKDLPYFVVVMNDVRFEETRDKEAFGFTLSMLFVLFFFLCLIYFIMFKVSARKSKLPGNPILTEWMLPRHGMSGCYIQAFVANVIVIVLLIIFLQKSDVSFMANLFIMIFAAVLSPLFLNLNYWKLYSTLGKKPVSSSEAMANFSFNIARLKKYKRTSVIVLGLLLALTEVLGFRILDEKAVHFFLVFQACILVIFTTLFFASPLFYKKYKDYYHKINNRNNYIRFYSLMAVTSLIISSGFPVMLFYTQSYNFEQNLIISYKHSLFADKLKTKFDLSWVANRILKRDTVPPAWSGIYVDSSWIRKIEIDTSKNIKSFMRESCDDILSGEGLFNSVRMRRDKNELAVLSDNFYNNISEDSSRVYYGYDPAFEKKDFIISINPQTNDTIIIKGVIPAKDTSKNNDSIISCIFSYKDTDKKIYANITCNTSPIDTSAKKDTLIIRNIIAINKIAAKNDSIIIKETISINETKKNDTIIFKGITVIADTAFIRGIISVFKVSTPSQSNSVLKIKSGEFNYAFPKINTATGFIYWLLLMIVLFIFYQIILKVVIKVFALKLPDFNNFRSLDENVFSESGAYKLLFIIGLPGSGKSKILNHYLNSPATKDSNQIKTAVEYLDMIYIPDSSGNEDDVKEWNAKKSKALNSDCDCYVINHFEYNLINVNASRIKLNLLEQLMTDPKKRILILSSIELHIFLETLMEQDSLSDADAKILKEDFDRWNVLLGHYKTLYVPLQKNELITIPNSDSEIEKTLYWECKYNHFLEKIYESWIDRFRNDQKNGKKIKNDLEAADDLIYELQNLAHHAYNYLWSSLSPEEKFIVHDLAEEGLVNSYDSYRLGILIKKGVIVSRNRTLSLFNKSFRNFVLTSISRQDELKIMELMKDEGNWSKFKTPLIVGIIAIMIFLLSSQKEILNQVLTILGALAAGIPIVIKFLSMGSSKPDDKK